MFIQLSDTGEVLSSTHIQSEESVIVILENKKTTSELIKGSKFYDETPKKLSTGSNLKNLNKNISLLILSNAGMM